VKNEKERGKKQNSKKQKCKKKKQKIEWRREQARDQLSVTTKIHRATPQHSTQATMVSCHVGTHHLLSPPPRSSLTPTMCTNEFAPYAYAWASFAMPTGLNGIRKCMCVLPRQSGNRGRFVVMSGKSSCCTVTHARIN
jgi:hypothetical protein